MPANNLVTAEDLGIEFDTGNIQANKIRLKLGPNLSIAPDGTIDVDLTQTVTTGTIYAEFAAGGSSNGAITSFERGCTVTPTGTGQWSVVFDDVHPDDSGYHVSFSWEESGVNRDNPKIGIVQGSKNENGFNVMITVDDNGGTADGYSDQPWTFQVIGPVSIVTGVTLS